MPVEADAEHVEHLSLECFRSRVHLEQRRHDGIVLGDLDGAALAYSWPASGELTIGFAHAAYQMAATFAARETGIRHFEVRDLDALREEVAAPVEKA